LSDYDERSVQSIVDYAGRLIGRTLAEVVDLPDSVSESKGKGKLGQLVEKYFFEIQPPNSHAPDFPEAGLELKTTGVVKGPKQPFLAKERLVLTNINFNTIHLESWESSTLLTKCKLMLLLFYLFDSEVMEIDRKFVLEPTLMNLLSLSANDLAQIVSDWNYIREKVASKRAHELSEGDTTYLKACRKGSGGVDERLASQPNTDVRAQTRAFSFPASFISRHLREGFPNEPSLLSAPGQTVEQATAQTLTPYFGMLVAEISSDLGWASKSKRLHWELVTRMLTGTGSKPVELEKAQIQLRTITIDSKGVPTENFPFLAFDYLELAKEEWENSGFADDLEQRYLLAVFEKDAAGVKRFKTAGYWTMPFGDRTLAKDVWAITRGRVLDGNYQLPKRTDHPIAFVNTHARNASDLVPTPLGGWEKRRSFWLNRHYLAHVIDSQLSPG
jgi:DNA mismatch repair protein MutH